MQIGISFFFIVEIVGTIAFACFGAMVAIKKHLDLLGVIVLGGITAVGGGMIRDIMIGKFPPTLFENSIYVILATVASVTAFVAVKYLKSGTTMGLVVLYETVMNFFDAIGLGAFTVVGVNTGIAAGYSDYSFLLMFLGVITGVGGGIMRDIMAGQTPYILKRHIYACASIAGAVCCVYLPKLGMELRLATGISAMVVIAVRFLAWHYKWNLPTA